LQPQLIVMEAKFLEQQFLGKWVAATYRATQMFMAEKLKKLKIGYGQFPFLCYLNRCGPASQEEIANALFFDKGTTARALKKLEELGFVARKVSGHDSRRNDVEITQAGKTVATEIRKILKSWNNTLTDGMNAEEKGQAQSILIRLASNSAEKVKDLHRQQADRRMK